jgi:hypothetical protein
VKEGEKERIGSKRDGEGKRQRKNRQQEKFREDTRQK